MNSAEARELRATLSRALGPLYAARVGALPAPDAVLRAIAALHAMDRRLLAVLTGADDDGDRGNYRAGGGGG